MKNNNLRIKYDKNTNSLILMYNNKPLLKNCADIRIIPFFTPIYYGMSPYSLVLEEKNIKKISKNLYRAIFNNIKKLDITYIKGLTLKSFSVDIFNLTEFVIKSIDFKEFSEKFYNYLSNLNEKSESLLYGGNLIYISCGFAIECKNYASFEICKDGEVICKDGFLYKCKKGKLVFDKKVECCDGDTKWVKEYRPDGIYDVKYICQSNQWQKSFEQKVFDLPKLNEICKDKKVYNFIFTPFEKIEVFKQLDEDIYEHPCCSNEDCYKYPDLSNKNVLECIEKEGCYIITKPYCNKERHECEIARFKYLPYYFNESINPYKDKEAGKLVKINISINNELKEVYAYLFDVFVNSNILSIQGKFLGINDWVLYNYAHIPFVYLLENQNPFDENYQKFLEKLKEKGEFFDVGYYILEKFKGKDCICDCIDFATKNQAYLALNYKLLEWNLNYYNNLKTVCVGNKIDYNQKTYCDCSCCFKNKILLIDNPYIPNLNKIYLFNNVFGKYSYLIEKDSKITENFYKNFTLVLKTKKLKEISSKTTNNCDDLIWDEREFDVYINIYTSSADESFKEKILSNPNELKRLTYNSLVCDYLTREIKYDFSNRFGIMKLEVKVGGNEKIGIKLNINSDDTHCIYVDKGNGIKLYKCFISKYYSKIEGSSCNTLEGLESIETTSYNSYNKCGTTSSSITLLNFTGGGIDKNGNKIQKVYYIYIVSYNPTGNGYIKINEIKLFTYDYKYNVINKYDETNYNSFNGKSYELFTIEGNYKRIIDCPKDGWYPNPNKNFPLLTEQSNYNSKISSLKGVSSNYLSVINNQIVGDWDWSLIHWVRELPGTKIVEVYRIKSIYVDENKWNSQDLENFGLSWVLMGVFGDKRYDDWIFGNNKCIGRKIVFYKDFYEYLINTYGKIPNIFLNIEGSYDRIYIYHTIPSKNVILQYNLNENPLLISNHLYFGEKNVFFIFACKNGNDRHLEISIIIKNDKNNVLDEWKSIEDLPMHITNQNVYNPTISCKPYVITYYNINPSIRSFYVKSYNKISSIGRWYLRYYFNKNGMDSVGFYNDVRATVLLNVPIIDSKNPFDFIKNIIQNQKFVYIFPTTYINLQVSHSSINLDLGSSSNGCENSDICKDMRNGNVISALNKAFSRGDQYNLNYVHSYSSDKDRLVGILYKISGTAGIHVKVLAIGTQYEFCVFENNNAKYCNYISGTDIKCKYGSVGQVFDNDVAIADCLTLDNFYGTSFSNSYFGILGCLQPINDIISDHPAEAYVQVLLGIDYQGYTLWTSQNTQDFINRVNNFVVNYGDLDKTNYIPYYFYTFIILTPSPWADTSLHRNSFVVYYGCGGNSECVVSGTFEYDSNTCDCICETSEDGEEECYTTGYVVYKCKLNGKTVTDWAGCDCDNYIINSQIQGKTAVGLFVEKNVCYKENNCKTLSCSSHWCEKGCG